MLFRFPSARHRHRIEAKLDAILANQETIMATLNDVLASQAAEDAEIKLVLTTLQGVQTSNADLVAQVAALQAQIAAGSGVSAADLDALKADMDAQKAAIDAALAPASPPAAPAPAG